MKRHLIGSSCRRALPLVLLLVVAAGCGDNTATVRGKVTYKGKSLTMGSVVLIGADGRRSARGVIREDGTYAIAKAPTGQVKVGVSNPPPTQEDGPALAAKYVASPDAYTDPEKSGLTYDVSPGTTIIDIDMTGPLR